MTVTKTRATHTQDTPARDLALLNAAKVALEANQKAVLDAHSAVDPSRAGVALTTQRLACREWAAARGYQIAGE